MVGIVVISHSKMIADGVVCMAKQMGEDVPIVSAGGADDNRLGTCPIKISEAIKSVYSKDGVIVLFDLGSAYMNAEMALEFLDCEYDKDTIKIIDAALVEGAIISCVQSSINKNMNEIIEELKPLALSKIS